MCYTYGEKIIEQLTGAYTHVKYDKTWINICEYCPTLKFFATQDG